MHVPSCGWPYRDIVMNEHVTYTSFALVIITSVSVVVHIMVMKADCAENAKRLKRESFRSTAFSRPFVLERESPEYPHCKERD